MVPVFTTAQAAITFTAVPGLITAIWGLCGRLFPVWGSGDGVAVVLALLFGLLIWWQSAPTEETSKARTLGIIYAFINSLSLAAVTLGIASFDK